MNHGRKQGLLALGLLFFLNSAGAATPTVSVNGRELPAYREGEIIVKFKDDVERTLGFMDGVYRHLNVVNVQRFAGALKNFEHLTFQDARMTVEQAIDELARDPAVEYVQPNYMMYALTDERMPSDEEEKAEPCFIDGVPFPLGCENHANFLAIRRVARPRILPRPGYHNPPLADPMNSKAWGLAKIGAQQAWNLHRGAPSVTVAVIDSGIDYNHPDLAANIWRNPGYRAYSDTGVDAQGKVISGDVVGWDFVHNDNLPYDDNSHGTHVAGTIGAVGGNGRGLSGVSAKVSMIAVKFLAADGSGATSDAIRAVDYAVSRRAKVINNSWGGSNGYNPALRDAIQRSERAGALFVVAAGNSSNNNDARPTYPANYSMANVLSVAATTSRDSLAAFSNYGATTVDMGAPGEGIYSTVPGGGYGYKSGTSMACPHVAGAAALLWARFPSATAAQIKRRLLASGDALTALRGRTSTGRRLNLIRAMNTSVLQ